MAYELYLFDLDDTLLDFKESERLSFGKTMTLLGIPSVLAPELFELYKQINAELWRQVERGQTTQSLLKTERFRRTFASRGLDIDAERAGKLYLEQLPENVVLVEGAEETCRWAASRGEVGILTNGILSVQEPRIRNSPLAALVSFVAVSEACGFAKPDRRFFEYGARMARKFAPHSTLMVGDKLETDILGARDFGIDACWYNPLGDRSERLPGLEPTREIRALSELKAWIEG